MTRKGSRKTSTYDKEREKLPRVFKGSIDIIVMLLSLSELLRYQDRDGGKEEGAGGILLGSK